MTVLAVPVEPMTLALPRILELPPDTVPASERLQRFTETERRHDQIEVPGCSVVEQRLAVLASLLGKDEFEDEVGFDVEPTHATANDTAAPVELRAR